MFFILSKLLQFLIAPLTWVMILLLVRLLVRSSILKKRLFVAAIVLLLIFSNKKLVSVATNAYQPKPVVLAAGTNYSCGILLGGMGSYDEMGKGYFNENADRFIQAAKLYHQKLVSKILITGGSSSLSELKLYNEATFIRSELINVGVLPADIIVEGRARNTHENAVYSLQLLDSLKLHPPYILITSATHMPRSKKVFENAGMKHFIVYPTSYTLFNGSFFELYILPSAAALNQWNKLFKEWFGMLAYRVTGKA